MADPQPIADTAAREAALDSQRSFIVHQLVKRWPSPQRGQCFSAPRRNIVGRLGRSPPAMSVGFSSPIALAPP